MRSRAAVAGRPAIRAMWTTNSVADTSGGKQSCSGMYPTRSRMPAPWVATSMPRTEAVPSLAGERPNRILIRVDLPAPLAPTRPVTPGVISMVSRSSAVTLGNLLVRFSVAMTVTLRP